MPSGLAVFTEHFCYGGSPEIRNKEIRLKIELLRTAALVQQISWQENCYFVHQVTAPLCSPGGS